MLSFTEELHTRPELVMQKCVSSIEFFTVCTKLAKMAILYSKDLTTAKKKLPPVGVST